MIRLAPPSETPSRAILQSRGGFLWWYLDLVNDRGDGLVLIWSFGLPFLPGYASAARMGRSEFARDLPCLNVVVYEGGREAFYLLQQLQPQEARWAEGERVILGESELHSIQEGAERIVRARLRCPLPGGGLLEGEVEARGVAVSGAAADSSRACLHVWTPLLAPGHGHAKLSIDGQARFSLEGRAYHDRNGSPQPLHDLGIERWFWARCAAPDGERILYALWPETGEPLRAFTLHAGADGQITRRDDVEVQLERPHRTLYGVPSAAAVRWSAPGEPEARVELGGPVDKGPFYLRFLGNYAQGDARGPAVAEWVLPARVDQALHRPFVRMRVHAVGGQNSPLLPWFSGPTEGRWSRLGRALLGAEVR